MEERHIKWDGRKLTVLDQRALPNREIYLDLESYKDVAWAIKEMVVRGAPLIGIVAAFGVVLGFKKGGKKEEVFKVLSSTRPTARNLFWALEAMEKVWGDERDLEEKALEIWREDVEANRKIGKIGASLIDGEVRILTHCNAGALATGGYGTALGVVRKAFEEGKVEMVYACETRPYLQGARLTVWELQKDGIPVTLVCDNMVGFLLWKDMVDLAVVGADRVAKNGDVANKIGTYGISVLFKEHKKPFYVAAPKSSWDYSLEDGTSIVIEERDAKEVLEIRGVPIAPPGTRVFNPSFDITPAENITAIISEEGVFRPR